MNKTISPRIGLALSALACALIAPCNFKSFAAEKPADPPTKAEVVVYEGTPGGVMAAVAAARQGHTVVLIELNNHVGGVVSGGLCDSDIGDRKTVGGLSKEFFDRIVKYYSDKYGPTSKQLEMSRNAIKFEPHVAELVFDKMLEEQHVTVWKRHRLQSVTRDAAGNVTSIVADDLANGGTRTFTGKIFIDASYEGDLMAGANVPYRYGREGRTEYGEYLAGIGVGPEIGQADDKIMSYNYRVSITPTTANAVPFFKPEHYDPAPYERTVGKRIINSHLTQLIQLFASGPGRAGPNDKLDTNWFDFPGSSYGYADGDWAARELVAAKIRENAQGFLYYLQNGPDLPEDFRKESNTWGYPKDEFIDTKHFPFQLYVREARRMVGQVVLNEYDITQNRYKADGVCEGSYGVDCHTIQELNINGKQVPDTTRHYLIAGYDIPYGTLVPQDKPGQPGNLLVPVCCSTTHVVYCSLRMEPVYMMLGQASGDAAHLALAGGKKVQKVDVNELRAILRKEGAQLDWDYQPQVKIGWMPAHPKPGETVRFKVESGEVRSPLKLIKWDFHGDGNVSAEGSLAQTIFKSNKTYSVSLFVEDAEGRRRMVSAEVPVGNAAAKDVTVDDFDAETTGRWEGCYPQIIQPDHTRIVDVWIGPGSRRDLTIKDKKIKAAARFQPELVRAGRYQICLAYRPAKGLATNAPVTIHHAGGDSTVKVDQQKETTVFPFASLGEFKFPAGNSSYVEITNDDTDGNVSIDGVRWVWLGE